MSRRLDGAALQATGDGTATERRGSQGRVLVLPAALRLGRDDFATGAMGRRATAAALRRNGDIEANGAWANGKWVVVQRRLLNTGHDDDVVFSPPKPIPFGLAVVDNGGGVKHTVAPDELTLARK